jgi:hypothetical protein
MVAIVACTLLAVIVLCLAALLARPNRGARSKRLELEWLGVGPLAAAAPRPVRTLPLAEELELRLAPAQFVMTAPANVAGGLVWSNPNCWNHQVNGVGQTPGPLDDATFDGTQSNQNLSADVAFNAQMPLKSITFLDSYTGELDLNANVNVRDLLKLTAATIKGPSALTVGAANGSGGLLEFDGGTISGTTVTLNQGAIMNIDPAIEPLSGGAVSFVGTGALFVPTLINNGTVNWASGTVNLSRAALIETGANGIFKAFGGTLANPLKMQLALGAAPAGEGFAVDPMATYSENGFHQFSVMVSAGGVFNVNSAPNEATWFADGSSMNNTSAVNIGVSDTLFLGLGEHDWTNMTETGAGTLAMTTDSTAKLKVVGTVNVDTFNQSVGTLDGPGGLTVRINYGFSGGAWEGGGQVTIWQGAALSMGQPSDNVNRLLTNNGTATFSSSIVLGAAMNVTNTGSMTLLQNVNIFDATLGGGAVATLTNSGTVIVNAPGGTDALFVPFTQSGTLTLLAGMADFTYNMEQTAGATNLNGGSLQVQGTFTIDHGSSLVGTGAINVGNLVNNGTITVGWAGDPHGQLAIQAIANLLSEVFTINQGQTQGVFSVQGAGPMANSGNFAQGATGTLNLGVYSFANQQFNKLTIARQASLGGALNLIIGAGYTPAQGDNFSLITWGALDPVNNAFATTPAGWTAAYGAGGLTETKN